MKDNFWVEEVNGQQSVPIRRKRKVVQRKIQFIGWGSKPLIEFLQSIGEDASKKYSKVDLVKTITRYVKTKCLNSPEKKKKIVCDERLYALFGKKSLSQAKIHYLLEEHLAENHDESDDEDCSEEENYEEKSASGLKTGPTSKIIKVPETPKSCYAAIIPENIKLIYLRRSLVQDLLKVPEYFETKVVGSFVRLKSDRNDIFQKHRFHLEQVTGIKYVSGAADVVCGVHLQVSNCINDTPISMLSDDNFLEEECEDLRDRVKSGSLKRPTVVELEIKAQLLHVDITKHWIPKELSLLQNLIDRANEKGWRKEKFEYLERRKLLQIPSEQEKLLLNIPKVIAEELDLDNVPAREKAEGTSFSPQSIFRGSSDVSIKDAAVSGTRDLLSPPGHIFNGSEVGKERPGHFVDAIVAPNDPDGSKGLVSPSQLIVNDSEACRERCGGFMDGVIAANDPGIKDLVSPSQLIVNDSEAYRKKYGGFVYGVIAANNPEDQPSDFVQIEKQHSEPPVNGNYGLMTIVDLEEMNPQQKPEEQEVIDLSDDELPPQNSKNEGQQIDYGDLCIPPIWHYVDPQGIIQGPFSLYDLKRWSDADYFHPGFTVWRSGQSQHDAVPLLNLLHQIFPL
ncbi:uncharacterized protein At5g08430-like isoform X2 [Olea europaea var. sylvestris]|uniref:uncharacterized protein At5g08430-like isoform X2 n=1 Tax=Olea europaea var. sylvestris TaxID=158386 RepID=UPI000C1D035B|nr:uncharacterized protein At5g08430-like isoform X2 [Olea europaea var. sylvestris]